MAMELQISNAESLPAEPNSHVVLDKQRLKEFIADGSLDFDEWTSLISEIENTCSDDIGMISLVYDSFLAEFPLCYGYWRKYADHKARLCDVDIVVEVFERAVQSATYSIDMWFHYCSFGMLMFEDPHDVRRLFKRGFSFVGKDYSCHILWDKYIEFEISQQCWSLLAYIYVQILRFPSKKLHRYHDSFKKLAAAWKKELECHIESAVEFQSELVLEGEVPTYYKDNEISSVIKDLLDPSDTFVRSKALQKYLFIGEQIFKEAHRLDEKINCFETRIRRPYFHVKPLDDSQLENWHDYLNFAEKQGDFDWVVKLYERCLIPCANYPEFWMRYVDFMEIKGGREIANHALARATQIFLKRLPVIHLFCARYKEQIGDSSAARDTFPDSDIDSDSRFIETIINKANMEKRLGNFVAASDIYKEALETAIKKRKLRTLPLLYVHFSRFTYLNTDSADSARDILIDGIKHVPHCKLLLEELIKFSMIHGGPRHLNIVDAVISDALYSGSDELQAFSLEDVEEISSLYLQFVDLCGTIHDVRNAWNRHIKLFPHIVRTAFECPARETKSLRTFIVGKRESIVASPPQPSESDQLMHSPSQDEKLSPPEKNEPEADRAASSSVISSRKSPLQENHDIQSDGAEVDIFQSGEADSSSQEKMQPLPPEALEKHSQDACQPEVLSFDLLHEVANENEAKQASEEFSKDDVQQEYEHESRHDQKPLLLEGLSLEPAGNDSLGSMCATSHEFEAPHETNLSHESTLKGDVPHETSLSDGSMHGDVQNNNGSHFASSPMGTQASSSAPIQTGTVSPSSSASHQNFVPEAHSRPQTPANSGRNWHHKQIPDRVHRDSRFGFRGHSHKRQHQQRRFSSQHYPPAETGTQMPTNLAYPSQHLPSPIPQAQQGSQVPSQFVASPNLTAPQGWPMQNTQQQNFASVGQSELPGQPVFYPQAHLSQYPAQSSEQHVHLQNNLAYNQMWQYYYQQQQQQFFLQQQQLQLPHQQPIQPQQQYLQQQYSQQQVLLPMHQQPHLQQQQYLPQQLLQQQQHLLYLQPQPQQQQLQFEQHQLQQQVQLQDQQPLQQQGQEQIQCEQKNSMSQIETWNDNCSKQDQGVAPPHSAVAFANTPATSPSPHLHQESPQSR